MLVIADLLGVPESDHDDFRGELLTSTGTIGSSAGDAMHHSPLEYLYGRFTDYITERRNNPRDDVLRASRPRLLTAAPRRHRRGPRGRQLVRRRTGDGGSTAQHGGDDDRGGSGAAGEVARRPQPDSSFVEEALRVESPIRGDFRLSKVPVTIGGVELPAGTTVMLNNAAANRDPQRFTDPDTFDVDVQMPGSTSRSAGDRTAARRSARTCRGESKPQSPTGPDLQIWINEDKHGPADNRHYRYLPTFILRGLTRLHIEFS